ncbi:restriction endonuclease subunit S [Eubacterium sp. MSJ-33]|uniref:restriction endonuclease subunit S n=1 Tax=Eubacterium sp. MSJ-33 TaxID=2841528 RepID=UPI001C772004|nr:restriction endonuclease subunit S [Eubacterium sp. MSJ-33]QWT54271.1 restriction endonuclease subunit S [Eubacterium sp. MSJ-33]
MNTPKIRFKGFTDAWEQRKFSDLYVKVSEKNDLSFGADKIISVANMYFKQDIKESGDDYMRTYNVMRLGDIAFEGNKSKNYAHGRFVENTIGDGIVSHVFDVFRPIVDYDLSYWKYFINNEGIMGRIMARCTKSSTMMTNLVANDFLKEFVLVPALAEQKEIGEYFRNLDKLITLHQRKCDETKQLKKFMLQKMFPKNGEKNPEIRFEGFTDDWEQRKFSDLYVKVSEKNDLSFGADKIISVANMYFKQDIKESGDDYMRTYNVMRLGDIAFEGNKSKNYAHGRFVENTIGDGIVSHVFDVFRPIVDYDLSYWKYFINNEGIMGRIMARCTKSSTMMTNLVANDFLKEFVLVPALAEQKEIGEYFRNLDKLITLHQRKCEKLKELKKFMLQNMFV